MSAPTEQDRERAHEITKRAVFGVAYGRELLDEAIAAALQAERERTRAEWQPIETAPKETPNVLVCMTNGTLLVARCDLGHWKIVGASLQTMYATPTHWMPLPEPPALKAAQLPQGE